MLTLAFKNYERTKKGFGQNESTLSTKTLPPTKQKKNISYSFKYILMSGKPLIAQLSKAKQKKKPIEACMPCERVEKHENKNQINEIHNKGGK